MKASGGLILLVLVFQRMLGQIYPTNFKYNGCSYAYEAFQKPDTFKCFKTKYKLKFEDLFDSTALNTDRWQTSYPWGRALHSKSYGTGWEQTYMLDENVSVSDGLLHLKIKSDPTFHPSPDNPNENVPFNYSSGMLYSKAGFGRGKFEINCKIPPIEGLWPAFWMYGYCGQELDVFEFTNVSETSDPNMDAGSMIMTYHRQYDCADTSSGACGNGLTINSGQNLSLDFHTYSLEWDEFKLMWKLDGRIMREVCRLWTISPPYPDGPINGYAYPVRSCQEMKPNVRYTEFSAFPVETNPMHVIVGSSVLLKEHVSVPQEFLVDYIRVYEEEITGVDSLPTGIYDFDVFPNPTTAQVNLPQNVLGKPVEKIEIINALGQPCPYEWKIQNERIIIDLRTLPKGFYTINALINGWPVYKKILFI